MKPYKYIFLYVLFSLNTNISKANNLNLLFQHYTTEAGLSQNNVDCIFRDSRGFIWVGTWDGLNRFDGYSFITYRPQKNENSISNGFIYDITEDKKGNIWIATRDGINKFIFETETFVHFKADSVITNTSISDNYISTLLFDKKGNLWIGTLNAGVEKLTFDENYEKITSVTRYNIDFFKENCITSENIYSLLEDKNGYIYVGSILGLDRINPETGTISKFTNIYHPYHFEATVIHSLFEDSQQTLWIGTESGVISINYKKKQFIKYDVDRASIPGTNKKALSHGLIKSINEDLFGNILIGTLGGLHKYNKITKEFYLFPDNNKDKYALNNKFINDILCDEKGNVWVGTEKGGLNKYNDKQKKFYFFANDPNDEKSLNNNIINSIYEDNNFLWIGTAGGGLNRYDKEKQAFSHYTHNQNNKSTISLNFISALTGMNNEIWAGTWGCGINKGIVYENSSKMKFQTHLYYPEVPDGPPFIYISSLVYDYDSNLWIGRPDGLQIYDAKKKKFYTVQPCTEYGNVIKSVGCLYIDSYENIWVGTPVGLYKMKLLRGLSPEELSKPDTIVLYKHNVLDSTSLGGDFIVSILQDNQRKMWFSTYGKGVSRLENVNTDPDKAKFTHYTQEEGLSNNVVYGMLEDNRNNLWLSTDRGLTKYNYIDSITTNYFESDGLQSNQFYWSAFFKNKDGKMYFGGTKGLNFFNPDSIKNNDQISRVVITDFKLFNQSQEVSKGGKLTKTISETKEIELEYNENIISFEFSSLSYFAPEKNRYRYKMEGFDQNWTYTSSDRRYVTYTNLNPGTYHFLVNGSNNDGVWNEKPCSVKLIVNPPWWQTIFFRLSFLFLIIGILVTIYVLRIRGLEMKKIQLESIVLERTKELNIKSDKLTKQTKELNDSNTNLKLINETKDKLLAIIAHDLKNPFNVILGMFDLLVKNYDKYDDERKKDMISIVNNSSINLYKLLENLLQWARSKTGNIDYDPEIFNISDIVSSNIKLVENQMEDKNIAIDFDSKHNVNVYADINLTDTILRNLISNAVKFTSEGNISILITELESNMVLIEVQDSGVGIAEDKLAKIFNIEQIGSTKGTKGESGTGLGLIICKDFAEKNGGEISVESTQDIGSKFSFTLPSEKKNI